MPTLEFIKLTQNNIAVVKFYGAKNYFQVPKKRRDKFLVLVKDTENYAKTWLFLETECQKVDLEFIRKAKEKVKYLNAYDKGFCDGLDAHMDVTLENRKESTAYNPPKYKE